MKNVFNTRQLGNTNLNISTLGFGAASMGNLYQPVSDEEAKKTLSSAIDIGINYFDTAPRYGAGLSERRVGDALRELPKQDYILSTKVGRLIKPDAKADVTQLRHGFATPMPFDAQYDYSYDGIMRSFEDSQQRLGLAEIDILLVHDLGRDTHGDRDSFYFMQFEQGGYRALDELKSSGQIKAIGLGVNEVEICKRAMNIGQFDCFLLAGRYSLLEQEPVNEFLPQCIANGTSIILGGPYNSGILATGVRTNKTPFYNYNPAPKEVILKVDRIEQICLDHNVTLAAAALQFPLAHPAVASVIPGLGNAKRVAKTVQLFNEGIPCAFWQDLKSEQLLAENAPVPM
jgi:D-threo-aldose 1-dehydrogenase